jgi:hypothetical protein
MKRSEGPGGGAGHQDRLCPAQGASTEPQGHCLQWSLQEWGCCPLPGPRCGQHACLVVTYPLTACWIRAEALLFPAPSSLSDAEALGLALQSELCSPHSSRAQNANRNK